MFYRPEIISVSPAHELSTIIELDTTDTANKSQISTKSPFNKIRKKLIPPNETASIPASPLSIKSEKNNNKCKPSMQVAPLSLDQSKSSCGGGGGDKSSKKSEEKSLEEKKFNGEIEKNLDTDSMLTVPDVRAEQFDQSNHDILRISQISELHSLPDETIDQMVISELHEESVTKSVTPEKKKINDRYSDKSKNHVSLTSTASVSGISGVSEISTSPTSDQQRFKVVPSSSDEMDLVLKKWGLGSWVPTLKKTREASALGSSSSSDVTPVNIGTRLVTSIKKETTPQEQLFSEMSDVSSISNKNFENKSTERSVLGKAGRTSTPNRNFIKNHLDHNQTNNSKDSTINHNEASKISNRSNVHSKRSNDSNSDESVSISSFSSDLNIQVQNHSAEVSVPNMSFLNNNSFG